MRSNTAFGNAYDFFEVFLEYKIPKNIQDQVITGMLSVSFSERI